jgi:hypothetical protein
LKVWEWHRLGRRCLFAEAADGRTVGMLNVNTGVVTVTNETERPLFEAAIAAWFAEALEGPAAATALRESLSEPLTGEQTLRPAPVTVNRPQVSRRASAHAKAREEGRQPPVRTLLAGIVRQRTDEPARHRKR